MGDKNKENIENSIASNKMQTNRPERKKGRPRKIKQENTDETFKSAVKQKDEKPTDENRRQLPPRNKRKNSKQITEIFTNLDAAIVENEINEEQKPEEKVIDVEAISEQSTQEQKFAQLENCNVQKAKIPEISENSQSFAPSTSLENGAQSNFHQQAGYFPNPSEYYNDAYIQNRGTQYGNGHPYMCYRSIEPAYFPPTMFPPNMQQYIYSTNTIRPAFGNGKPTTTYVAQPSGSKQKLDNNEGVIDLGTLSSSDSMQDSDSTESYTDETSGIRRKRLRKKPQKKQKIKRPMNAFMVWAKKHRPRYSRKYPNMTNSVISVRLGEMWSKMTKEQKKPYFEEAARIKEQHKIDHPNWTYQPRPRRAKQQNNNMQRIYGVNNYVRQASSMAQIPPEMMMQQSIQPFHGNEQFMNHHNLSPIPYQVFAQVKPPAEYQESSMNAQFHPQFQQAHFANQMQLQNQAYVYRGITNTQRTDLAPANTPSETAASISADETSQESTELQVLESEKEVSAGEEQPELIPVANVKSHSDTTKTDNSANNFSETKNTKCGQFPMFESKLGNMKQQQENQEVAQKTYLPSLHNILQKRDLVTAVDSSTK